MPEQLNIDHIPFYLPQGTTKLNINERGLMDSIPVDCDEEDYLLIQNSELVEFIKQDELEIEGVKFRFSDDTWDFTSIVQGSISKRSYKYNFCTIKDDYYKTLLKAHILYLLLAYGTHRTFISNTLLNERRFLLYLLECNIVNFQDVDDNVIRSYIEKDNNKLTTVVKYKTDIKRLYEFYCFLMHQELEVTIMDYLDERDVAKLKIEKQASKFTLLTSNIIIPLVELFWDEFNNENNSNDDRRKSALLYIDTQTGLRPGELLILPYNCLTIKKIYDKTLYYLTYRITKTVYGAGYDETTTVANENVARCIEFLKSQVDENDDLGKNFTTESITNYMRKLIKVHDNRFDQAINRNDLQRINVYQFRVYFDTELRKRGFNDFQIAKMMGHKDEKMLGYYAREVDSIQEDIEYSKNVVTTILNEDINILGPRGDLYTRNMKNRLESSNITIEKSFNDAVDSIISDLPIRQKAGGFCICANRSRSCIVDTDEEINEVLCTYGLCPNQCHVYFDLTYYYNEFKRSITLVEKNKQNGHINAAQKELHVMQRKLEDYVIPEIRELERTIKEKGKQFIIEQHPELNEILNNLNKIKEEVKKWETKTI